jgi:rod shape-determining protein MreB
MHNFVMEIAGRNIKMYKKGVGIVLNEPMDESTLKSRVNSVCPDTAKQQLLIIAPPGASAGSIAQLRAIAYKSGFMRAAFLSPVYCLVGGFEYDFNEKLPVLSVVIGEEATDIAIVSGDELLASGTIPVGIANCVGAITAGVLDQFNTTITAEDAAAIFSDIGSLLPGDTRFYKFPDFIVKADFIRGLIYPIYEEIIGAINRILSDADVAVIRAVKDSGVIFGGAGADIRGLDQAIYAVLGLRSAVAADPGNAVIYGAGKLIENTQSVLKIIKNA